MIELVIKANRPELSDSSLKQYLSSLRTLNDKKPIQDIDFLKDYDSVMEKLSSKKPTTIKNYMNAIIVVLSAVKADPSLIDKYTKTRDDLNQQYSDEQATHRRTPTSWGIPRAFNRLCIRKKIQYNFLSIFNE
eukprot:SAG22_NODE_908_length_6553_cov_5.089247_4_plen_133_part_00